MKIGLISSGMETLSLFHFLTRYDHEYLIYFDSLNAPYGKKYFSTSLKNIEKGIEYLKGKGAELIIIPPTYELALLEKGSKTIFPLFSSYLMNEVFPHSLVGKLGIMGEFADLEKAQELIKNYAKKYTPSPEQKTSKKFSYPFHYRGKEVGILNPLLEKLSRKSVLTNTVIKQELRYFKDANVDTVIPLNYMYFNAEKTISKFLNFKKIRFHNLKKLENIFSENAIKNSTYKVSIYATNQKETLLKEKRIIRLIQRGKSIEIQRL